MSTIGPLDGRYREIIAPLATVFGEEGLTKQRIQVEIEYLLALVCVPALKVGPLKQAEINSLRDIFKSFGADDFARVKEIEQETKHDVKAVEYYICEKLKAQGLTRLIPWVHFGITSEDVNNLAQALQLKHGSGLLCLQGQALQGQLVKLIEDGQDAVMVARTHGQPAVPTTMGKELLVYALQLQELWDELNGFEYRGKLTGAVGTLAAHQLAYPEVDWLAFSQKFVESFGLKAEMVTTQIMPSVSLTHLFSLLERINLLIASLAQNLWWYVSLGYFAQKVIKNEVGSSTMPQKVNPIFLENAEGNSQLAASLCNFLVQKLSHSRLQRDLSDSTVRRNFGVAYGHLYISLWHVACGLERLSLNKEKMREEVLGHPEMYAEALQTLARKQGDLHAYEKAKDVYRGKKVTTDKRVVEYTGIAERLVEQQLPELKKRVKKLI